jgi:hypothetical protein
VRERERGDTEKHTEIKIHKDSQRDTEKKGETSKDKKDTKRQREMEREKRYIKRQREPERHSDTQRE